MTLATKTDRAAIEAIARELTDEQWSDVFEAAAVAGTRVEVFCGPVIHHDTCRALLAYLDEMWAGLTKTQRSALDLAATEWEPEHLWRNMPIQCRALRDRALIGTARDRVLSTALGRAVLKRAKERSR